VREKRKQSFSERNGLVVAPDQLRLYEISKHFRLLVDYALQEEIKRGIVWGPGGSSLGRWVDIAKDLHVKFYRKSIGTFDSSVDNLKKQLELCTRTYEYNRLFDLIEFFVGHRAITSTLQVDLINAFLEAGLAYRIIDLQVVAIGTAEQADAFLRAVGDAEENGFAGAREHLVSSGKMLTEKDWRSSVRESIHAVESVAKNISEDEKGTLGSALKKIGKRKVINEKLKAAFEKLYSYTNDENTAARHAIVFPDSVQVDEADALFMLGACASFVSYLIAKNVDG
jgi:hypothetical protein